MLQVNIVGAGIAGLSAAISLRRAGHIVNIYERSAMNNEVGAAINVPPNATRFLTAWGLDPVRWRFVKARRVTYKDPFTLETTALLATEKTASSLGGAELYYAHRVDLHSALKWMATRPDGPGKPVAIHLGSDIIGYDPVKPSIKLASGEEISGDVVIGADGVHSIASEAVTGYKNEPITPSYSNCCFRFLIPSSVLDEDPETKFWNEDREGWTRLMPHDETKRRLVVYPCRDNTMHNFVGIFWDDNMEKEKRENWQATVDVSEVLKRYHGYSPELLKIMSKATDVKRWPLLYRHPNSTWKKDMMVLVGDAAHPMLPHQGQGGAQGMEDGLVLGIVLHGAKTPEEVERRLQLYVDIRRNRASSIQILSNVGQDQSHMVVQELLQFIKEEEIPTSVTGNYKYNFGYDVVKVALDAMKKYDPSFELPSDFFESEVIPVPEAQ